MKAEMGHSCGKAIVAPGCLESLGWGTARLSKIIPKRVCCDGAGWSGGPGACVQPHGQHGGRRQHPRLVLRGRLSPGAAGQVCVLALAGCSAAFLTLVCGLRLSHTALDAPCCMMLQAVRCSLSSQQASRASRVQNGKGSKRFLCSQAAVCGGGDRPGGPASL